MFKIKIYCNDNGKEYWEDGVGLVRSVAKLNIQQSKEQ